MSVSDVQLSIERSPPQTVRQTLNQGIQRFNAAAVPGLEPVSAEKAFFVLAREGGGLVGGVRARCYWDTLHLELVWLSEPARGRGMGRAMVKAAEAQARTHGCTLAHVETTDWQATGFYEALGYEELARLDGRPRRHTTVWLSKTLQA